MPNKIREKGKDKFFFGGALYKDRKHIAREEARGGIDILTCLVGMLVDLQK